MYPAALQSQINRQLIKFNAGLKLFANDYMRMTTHRDPIQQHDHFIERTDAKDQLCQFPVTISTMILVDANLTCSFS